MASLKLSLFNHAKDPFPIPWEGHWETLVALLNRDNSPAPSLPPSEAKKSLPALSGATFTSGERRSRAHVLGIHALLLDIDNAVEVPTGEYHLRRDGRPTDRPVLRKVCVATPVLPAEVQEELQVQQCLGYLYSTWSSGEGWPRFRVIVPLSGMVPPEIWPEATEWALNHLGLNRFRHGLDLPVLRDTARIHFLPGSPTGTVQRWITEGQALEVPLEALSRVRVAPLALAPWQRALKARRALEGRWEHRWGVDLRTLDLAGLLAARGVVVGEPRPYGAALKWRCHCPWAGEHSHGIDDDSAVIIHEQGRFPVWHCAHSHHSHLGLRDILEWVGGAA